MPRGRLRRWRLYPREGDLGRRSERANRGPLDQPPSPAGRPMSMLGNQAGQRKPLDGRSIDGPGRVVPNAAGTLDQPPAPEDRSGERRYETPWPEGDPGSPHQHLAALLAAGQSRRASRAIPRAAGRRPPHSPFDQQCERQLQRVKRRRGHPRDRGYALSSPCPLVLRVSR